MPRLRQTSHSPDIPLLIGVSILLIFGVVMVYDASVVYAQGSFGGKYHFLLLQSLWAALGSLGAFVIYRLGYKRSSKFGFPILALGLVFLFLLAWPNIPLLKHFLIIPPNIYHRFMPEVYGARRWVFLLPGQLGFQPSELTKLALVFYLPAWLAKKSPSIISVFSLLGVLGGLILLQPDFGTAMIIVTVGLVVYFVSGVSLIKFIPLGVVGLLMGALLIIVSPYRMQRLQTYLNPAAADPLSSGYHIQQVLIAVGSGGPFGLGFGQSRQKYQYLPEVSSDSIFAVVAEEIGFIGSLFVVSLFGFIIWRIFKIAGEAADEQAKLLVAGVGGWIAVQVFLNLAAMTALIPLTGVPLPLISYGGSSMLFVLMALGAVFSVSRYTVRRKE